MADRDDAGQQDREFREMLAAHERIRREGERKAELRAVHDFASLRRRLLKQFGKVVGPHLRAIGFEGRLPHLHRVRSGVVDLLMLQVDRYGGGFTVNLARATMEPGQDPAAMRLIDVPFEDRARITRDPKGQADLWFRYDGPVGGPESQQDEALDAIVAHIAQADRWFRGGDREPHIAHG